MVDAQVHRTLARSAGAQLLAFLNLAGAAVLAFLGFLANGLRCDDSCSIAPGWRNDPHAWQWGAQFALTLVILGSALLLNVVAQIRHTPRLEMVAGALAGRRPRAPDGPLPDRRRRRAAR